MEDVVKRLKEKNIVLTPQRLTILDLIKKERKHFSAEEIYNAVKRKYPTISLATVYNILQKFVEVGEVQRLDMEKDRAYYDGEVSCHHHFYCKKCGNVLDVDVECNVVKEGKVKGHKIDSMQACFYGVCKDCRGRK